MKNKVITGMLWRFAERTGAMGVSFIVTLILGRLLLPDDFGLIAMITAITSILNTFVDSGFGIALIQKKNADNLDFSSVFYFNILVCLLLYLLLFLAAPYLALFFAQEKLTAIIRVLGLTVIVSGIKNVQQAYVSRNMLFRRFFFSTLGGTIGAAIIGISMAISGLGVWALVAQQLFNITIDTLILGVTVKWRPEKRFSFKRLRELFSFGWKVLLSGFVNSIYINITNLIIGKVYSSADLAFYNRGDQMPAMIANNINASIDSVLLPTISKEQDDPAAVKEMTRKAIRIGSYIMWPLMTGLGIVGEPLIRLLLTEKWLASVPYLRIFCCIYALWPVHTANLNAIKALGRSDIYLKVEIIKCTISLIILAATVQMGVMAMAIGVMLSSLISMVINTYPNRKLLNYTVLEQMKDILPTILLTAAMAICIYPFLLLGLPDLWTVIIQVAGGGIVYVLLSIVFKSGSHQYVKAMLKGLINRN